MQLSASDSSSKSHSDRKPKHVLINDIILICIMAVLAACGLIYEYLLSHYAGRILGSMETAIYSIIGLMIVSMGCGSFYARRFKRCFLSFAWLEVSVALLGASIILLISALIGFSFEMPQQLAQHYGIASYILMSEGFTGFLVNFSMSLPYIFAFLLGFLIGMEIPLMARIREQYYGESLTHNAGTIYGADYIGAGVGAAVWVLLMLKLEINQAAAMTASINLAAGLLFVLRFRRYLDSIVPLLIAHALLALMIVLVFAFGGQWQNRLQNMLYLEEVVYQTHTEHQNVVFTQHNLPAQQHNIIDFYINGSLQFSSMDEYIYHEMLVHPAMLAAARHDKVLIIGGGDGLALREVVKWQPQQVTLVDFDKKLVQMFQQPFEFMPNALAQQIQLMTEDSLNNPALQLEHSDAFLYLDQLIAAQQKFDVVIVDLPDPNHPDLNKLYSNLFYTKIRRLLAGDGIVNVQSNSPYHAKNVFLSIGKTLGAAGFADVQQYQQNVPTFGQWGWSLASPFAPDIQQKIRQSAHSLPEVRWVNKQLIMAAFVFPNQFYQNLPAILVNDINSQHIYHYHEQAWGENGGFNATLDR